jgi:hypothetical protein
MPVRLANAELSLADEPAVVEGEAGDLEAALALTIYDAPGQPRDRKEQRVVLVPAAHRGDAARALAYAEAWARALPGLMARLGDELESAMPHQLVYPEALSVAGARPVEELLALFGERDLLAAWDSARAEEEERYESSRECYRRLIEAAGVGAHAGALLELWQPSILLKTRPADGEAELGAARIGGAPDLPPGLDWPAHGGAPLGFVAQIDLDEIARRGLDPRGALPPAGLLYFFFDESRFDEPALRGGGRVLYYGGDRDRLRRAPTPPALARYALPPLSLEYALKLTAPPLESAIYPALLGARGWSGAYEAAFSTFGRLAALCGPAALGSAEEERPCHRLLGYADPLQSDVYASCEGEESGRPPDGWGEEPEFWRAAAEWQLLLQLDSEPGRRIFFGDGGLLYFMIRRRDLAERRFERVYTGWQSH